MNRLFPTEPSVEAMRDVIVNMMRGLQWCIPKEMLLICAKTKQQLKKQKPKHNSVKNKGLKQISPLCVLLNNK